MRAKLLEILREYGAFLLPMLVILPGIDGFIFPGSGAPFSDAALTHYPNVLLLQRAFNEGTVPLWSPQILSGFPFVAHPYSGLWYPPYWLAVLFPLPLGLNLLALAHLLWAGIGMYKFLGGLGLSRQAARLGGMAFQAAPRLFAHLGAGHLMLLLAACWTPWLLWATLQKRGRLAQPGPILAVIACIDPRWALYSAALWGAWALAQRRGLAYLAAQGALACVLALPALWLYTQYGALSTRAVLTPGEVLELSLPPSNLLGLLLPQWGGAHEWIVYPGILVLLLGLSAQPWKRASARFWLLAAALAVLLALGAALPGARWLAGLPGFSQMRIPPRAMLIASFALAVLAAFGYAWLAEGKHSARWVRLLHTGVLTFLVLIGALSFSQGAALWKPALGAALVALGSLALIELRARGRIAAPGAALLLISLLLGDLLLIDTSLLRFRTTEAVLGEGAGLAARFAEDERFRIYSPSYSLPQQTAALHGLELAGGVDPLQLQAYADFLADAGGYPTAGYSVAQPPLGLEDAQPDATLLGLLNVKYLVSAQPIQAESLRQLNAGDEYVYLNEQYRPRAWVQREDRYSEVASLDWGYNSITARADGPGMLVFSEIAYPGWRGSLDGQPAELLTYAGILRAVELPAGTHTVALRFAPTGLITGLPLALAAWALLLTWPRRSAP